MTEQNKIEGLIDSLTPDRLTTIGQNMSTYFVENKEDLLKNFKNLNKSLPEDDIAVLTTADSITKMIRGALLVGFLNKQYFTEAELESWLKVYDPDQSDLVWELAKDTARGMRK